MGLPAADLARLSTLLDEAEKLDPAALETWLAGLQGESARLAPALRAMLARQASKETDELFDRPPALGPPTTGIEAGDTVGPYRLERLLGRGGMGEVWLAMRTDGGLKRKVALKLPHVTWAPSLAERFARERDILSGLEHPNIARLYDAGVDSQGRPYMALEFIEGLPIDEFCTQQALPVESRVRLLLQVADAVAYAHGRLVVHRDLKPGNVLVTADGQARLLDFGIAKLMEGDRTRETALTQAAGRALTLDYASPEQIRGEPIGTASDVYSLGVVAFQLLAGSRPYRLKRESAAQLEEAIASVDAPLASGLATDPALKRRLKGDLDATLNKALKKNPAERYPTVDAFAQDLRRHLAGEAVTAQPDTRLYRLRKFVARNRIAVATGAVVAVVIVASALVALQQARQASEQARIARTEAETAKAVQEFLQGLFEASSANQPDPLKARQRTALELLDEGAARIEKSLDATPEAKFKAMGVMAQMYRQLSKSDEEIELQRRRVGMAERAFGPGDARLADALADLGLAHSNNGSLREARQALVRADRIVDALPRPDDPLRLKLDIALSDLHRFEGDPRGLPYAERAARMALRLPPTRDWVNAMASLGIMQRLAGQLDESAASFDRAIALEAQVPGGANSVLPTVHEQAAKTAQMRGDIAAAEAHLRRVMELDERISGPGSVNALTGRRQFAVLLADDGRTEEALAQFDAMRPWLQAMERSDRLTAASIYVEEAQVRRERGDPAGALALYDRTAPLYKSVEEVPGTFAMLKFGRGQALLDLGRIDEADATLAEGRQVLHKFKLQSPRWREREAIATTRLLLARGDAAAARQRLDAEAPAPPGRPGSMLQLLRAEALLAAGLHDEAAALAADESARAAGPPRAQPYAMVRFGLLLALGRARLAQGRPDEAHAALLDAASISRTLHDTARSLDAAALQVAVGEVALARGDRTRAAEALRDAKAIQRHHAGVRPPFFERLSALEAELARR